MSSSIYYRHSGKFNVGTLPALFAVPMLAGLVLAFVYSLIVFYNPFIYVNFLAAVFLSLFLGAIVAYMGEALKVRNRPMTLLAGFLTGTFTVYAAWVSYIYFLSDFDYLVLAPGSLFSVIQELAKGGIWSIGSFTPTGALLFLFWAVEAAIIVGGSVLGSVGSLADAVFCEQTGKWAEERRKVGPFQLILSPESFRSKIESGDYSELLDLKKANNEIEFSEVEFIGASGDSDLRLFSVSNVTRSTDKEGKLQEDRKNVVKNVISTQEINDSVLALLSGGTSVPNAVS